jgi:hypothetical protein
MRGGGMRIRLELVRIPIWVGEELTTFNESSGWDGSSGGKTPSNRNLPIALPSDHQAAKSSVHAFAHYL